MTGMPFNQLGTLAGSKYYNVEATYCYLRWWVSVRILAFWTENQCTVVAGARFFSPSLWICDCFQQMSFRGGGREMGLFHPWAGLIIGKSLGQTKASCWSLKYMCRAALGGQGFIWDPLPVLESQVWRGAEVLSEAPCIVRWVEFSYLSMTLRHKFEKVCKHCRWSCGAAWSRVCRHQWELSSPARSNKSTRYLSSCLDVWITF